MGKLKDLEDLEKKPLEEYLLKEWLEKALSYIKTKIDERHTDALKQLFREGKGWLLLDGLDEITASSSIKALARIKQELDGFFNGRVIITSRLNIGDGSSINLAGFETYLTLDFQQKQVEEFIQQWFAEADKKDKTNLALKKVKRLQSKLKETKNIKIKDLVRNPLSLSLLCQIFYVDDSVELPQTKAQLYRLFTQNFYRWKQEQHPDLIEKDKPVKKLHKALAKLSLAAIENKLRFRIKREFARETMGNKMFKLAWDLGWLNLVEKESQLQGTVYCFFHPTFQEYFAAQAVDDWHFFLDERSKDITKSIYGIFDSQWKEVILFWLGREDIKSDIKEKFISNLKEFRDFCQGFYGYQAYFLAAAGINEFQDCSLELTEEIVTKVIELSFGYFNEEIKQWIQFIEPITKPAKIALLETNQKIAIQFLIERLNNCKKSSVIQEIINILGKIAVGDDKAIATLKNLLEDKELNQNERISLCAAHNLGIIDPNNQKAIKTQIELLKTANHHWTQIDAAGSLQVIGNNDRLAINELTNILKTNDNTNILVFGTDTLEIIAVGNKKCIQELIEFINSDNNTWNCELAVSCLGKIAPGDSNAAESLKNLLQHTQNHFIFSRAVDSLKDILPDNLEIVELLNRIIQETENEEIKQSAFYYLEVINASNLIALEAQLEILKKNNNQIARNRVANKIISKYVGNKKAIESLDEIIQNLDLAPLRIIEFAEILAAIDPDNDTAIDSVIEIIEIARNDDIFKEWEIVLARKEENENSDDSELFALQEREILEVQEQSNPNSSYRDCCKEAIESLGKIGQNNPKVISFIIELLNIKQPISSAVFETLAKIASNNEIAIDSLIEIILDNDSNNSTRYEAISCLGKIAIGNEKAIEALITLVHTKERDIFIEACNSLENILQGDFVPQAIFLLKEFITDEIHQQNYLLYKSCYKLIDRCSQIVPYTVFYRACYTPNLEYYQKLLKIKQKVNDKIGELICSIAISILYLRKFKIKEFLATNRLAAQILITIDTSSLDLLNLPQSLKLPIKFINILKKRFLSRY